MMRNLLKMALMALLLLTGQAPAFAADKPLVMESGSIKQLPSATTLQLQATTTGAASINLPHGTAPSSPTNGDCWTTTAVFACRINGATASFAGVNSGDQFTAIANASLLGNNSGSTGAATALTGTQATALLDSFTSSLKGLAPASGGGTTNFLRADGAWAAPAGGGGGGSGTPSGTSFPGSPASGDQFLRTDRGIEYYYDGTRWLSKQLFILRFQRDTASSQPLTSSTAATDRSQNPHSGVYDIYLVDFVIAGVMTTASTSTNYYTAQLIKSATSTDTNIGTALSNQSDTTGAHVTHRESINAVAASTVQDYSINYNRVGTTATYYVTSTVSYRLIG